MNNRKSLHPGEIAQHFLGIHSFDDLAPAADQLIVLL